MAAPGSEDPKRSPRFSCTRERFCVRVCGGCRRGRGAAGVRPISQGSVSPPPPSPPLKKKGDEDRTQRPEDRGGGWMSPRWRREDWHCHLRVGSKAQRVGPGEGRTCRMEPDAGARAREVRQPEELEFGVTRDRGLRASESGQKNESVGRTFHTCALGRGIQEGEGNGLPLSQRPCSREEEAFLGTQGGLERDRDQGKGSGGRPGCAGGPCGKGLGA